MSRDPGACYGVVDHGPLPPHLAGFVLFILAGLATTQPTHAAPDVVVVVDTSTSMREPGYDPERTSLLVTKLLSDVVPGRLAVTRLLTLGDNPGLFPSAPTGARVPCDEDGARLCDEVRATKDWQQLAEDQPRAYGVLERPAQRDGPFKAQLEGHLTQDAGNSMFDIAFRASRGTLRSHGPADASTLRTLVWLSDGRTPNDGGAERAIRDLQGDGVAVEAIVFGRGDPTLPRRLGLQTTVTDSPAALMAAFAGAFRRILRAPFEQDGLVATQPDFEMKPHVDEAWVVVYGDTTLAAAWIEGPAGRTEADFAAETFAPAGAYRVAHVDAPAAGRYRVGVSGGGAGAAFAVVQRADLVPALLEPERATAGVEVPLVVGVRSGASAQPIAEPDLLGALAPTIEIEGRTLDAGTPGTDGRFSVPYTFASQGAVPVKVCIESEIVDRCSDATVQVSGRFAHTGPPLHVDLGELPAGTEACRPLPLQAVHQGVLPFRALALGSLPAGHFLEVRVPTGVLEREGAPVEVGPGQPWQVCLAASARAPSSASADEPALRVQLAGTEAPEQGFDIYLTWRVDGLSWLERWLWLIGTLIALLAIAATAFGWIWPRRFPPGLAIAIAASPPDLEEQHPQPIAQWKGIGIGWYRDARAYLSSTYRVQASRSSAVARLQMDRRLGLAVFPENGAALQRENLDGDWEDVPASGRRVRAGEIYRVGEDEGLLFRIALRSRR